MDIIQPSILSGFMELLPEDQVRFNRMKAIVEKNFQAFGFWPLDTPAIEKTEILFSKGGGETAKQVFRIERDDHSQDQALRFDLTVPLARYVAQHNADLAFPFRRYQISKVWRGERSQKGRYREFYQADIDIIGRQSLSLWNDAEVPAVIYNIFKDMGLTQACFHINNRRLLNGFFLSIGVEDLEETLRAVDKLGKIGKEGVQEILEDLGQTSDQIDRIFHFIEDAGSNEKTIDKLRAMNESGEMKEEFSRGFEDFVEVYTHMQALGIPTDNIKIDLSITRGLDYYTGMVYETFIKDHESIGSVCSGGRYDNLSSNFSNENFPGVGISIGLTRLFYQLSQANLVNWGEDQFIRALILPMSEEDGDFAVSVLNQLRAEGVTCQLYTESGKMKKKFSYADKLGAGYAIIIGEAERESGKISMKNLTTGDQSTYSIEEVVELLADLDEADER